MHPNKKKEIIRVCFVGMNLEPPCNELAGKLALMISRLSESGIKFSRISIPNRSALNSFQKTRLSRRMLISLDVLVVFFKIIAECLFHRSIIHFLLPGKSTFFLKTCIKIAKASRSKVIFTLLKTSPKVIGAGKLADQIICHSRPAFSLVSELVEHHRISFIEPSSIEEQNSHVERRASEILFMAMPWKAEDLERRGFFLLCKLANLLQGKQDDWTITILNRTKMHTSLLQKLVKENMGIHFNVVNEPVSNVAFHLCRSGMLLVPHLDNECPDPALSTIEALHCGTPVITTSFNGFGEVISDSNAGALCQPSESDFCRAVYQVREKNELYSRNAIKLAQTRYSLRNFLNGHAEAYKSLGQ